MFKQTVLIALFCAFVSAQLLPPAINIPLNEPFTVNSILGNYHLVGVYNNNKDQQLTQDLENAKCYLVELRITSDNTIMINYSYIDAKTGEKQTSNGLYIPDPENSHVLLSQPDYIFNWKYYKGQNDLIVKYYGQNTGEIIIEKRDGSMALVLSSTAITPTGMQGLRDKASELGLNPEDFVSINNNDC